MSRKPRWRIGDKHEIRRNDHRTTPSPALLKMYMGFLKKNIPSWRITLWFFRSQLGASGRPLLTLMSYCKFCIYTHPVNSKFTIWHLELLYILCIRISTCTREIHVPLNSNPASVHAFGHMSLKTTVDYLLRREHRIFSYYYNYIKQIIHHRIKPLVRCLLKGMLMFSFIPPNKYLTRHMYSPEIPWTIPLED